MRQINMKWPSDQSERRAARGSALAKARVLARATFFAILLTFILVYGTVLLSFTGILQLPPEVLVGAYALILTTAALCVAYTSVSVGVWKMDQAMENAEQHRSTDLALAEAMHDLAKELRRRPGASSSVTLALFALDRKSRE